LRNVTRIQDPKAVENVLTSINHYFQCTSPVGIDSAMRLPETTNRKGSSSDFQCRVKYINADFRYDFEEFEKLNLGLGEASDKSETPEASRVEGPPDLTFSDRKPEPRGLQKIPEPELLSEEEPQDDPEDYEEAGSLMHSEEVSSMVVGSGTEESQTVVVLAEESADLVADEIVEKVVDRLSDKLMERLVDEIVEKLVKRLTIEK
jgi:hypothetical protein